MKKLLSALLVASALLALSAVETQAAPPKKATTYHLTTVSWVVANRNNLSVDDNYVTLIGRVTGRKGDEIFMFSDGTGSIRLDSANFELPIGPRVVIGGRIDQAYLGFGHLEVDVRNWHYAK